MEAIIGVQVRRKDTLSREYNYTHFSANTSLTTHTQRCRKILGSGKNLLFRCYCYYYFFVICSFSLQ